MNATTALPLPLGPLDPERSELLGRVVDGLPPDTLQWISGFAAGVAYARSRSNLAVADFAAPTALSPAVPVAPRSEPSSRLAVVYGSQTGNGKRIAERLGRAAEAAGLAVRVYAARDYPLKDLAKERLLTVVMSTHGDGDPPDEARGFIEFLTGRRAPKLDGLEYSVLALGDSSYPKFCETGRQIDERLAALGAKRLLERVDCDVDFERLATPWVEKAVTVARDAVGGPPVATVTRLRPPPQQAQYSRERPFTAPVLANQRITGRNASKDVRHLEISLEGSGLRYEPGDSLGVWHENPALAVDAVLAAIAATGEESLSIDGQERSLREWLAVHREITRLTRPFLVEHARRADSAELAEILSPGQETRLRTTLKDLQVIDVLQRHPAAWEPEALVRALRPLAPRLASSTEPVLNSSTARRPIAETSAKLGAAGRLLKSAITFLPRRINRSRPLRPTAIYLLGAVFGSKRWAVKRITLELYAPASPRSPVITTTNVLFTDLRCANNGWRLSRPGCSATCRNTCQALVA